MEVTDGNNLKLKANPATLYSVICVDENDNGLVSFDFTTRQEADEAFDSGDVLEEVILERVHRFASHYGYRTYGAALAEIQKMAGQELSLIGAENWLEETGETCPA